MGARSPPGEAQNTIRETRSSPGGAAPGPTPAPSPRDAPHRRVSGSSRSSGRGDPRTPTTGDEPVFGEHDLVDPAQSRLPEAAGRLNDLGIDASDSAVGVQ